MNLTMRKLFAVSAAMLTAAAATAEVVTNDYIEVGGVQHSDWGKTITGLGANGDETALVFTKVATMSWTVPDGVTSARVLIVGGGGSGGSTWNQMGGGGAGAMREEDEVPLTAGGTVNVTVGAGASGTTGNVVGKKGSQSSFGTYAAEGGGAGGSSNGGNGGSGGGGGTKKAGGVANNALYGHNGGAAGNFDKYTGGGGGGAGAVGAQGGKNTGGNGGAGRMSNITGEEIYYAGGGGGGTYTAGNSTYCAPGGIGGGGTGGNRNGSIAATAGVNGLGGGGGGGDYGHTSGNGGSGVVVVRYQVISGTPVDLPIIASVTYDGQPHSATVPASEDYVVTTLPENVVNAGEYDVVFELGDGRFWSDTGLSAPRTVKFVINRAANNWTTQPGLSKVSWEFDEAPAEVTMGVPAEGNCTLTFDEGALSMPTTIGNHTAHFAVPTSLNYTGMTNNIAYTVSPNANAWDPVPAISITSWVYDEEPGVLTANPSAKYGEVTVVYDDDPDLTAPVLSGIAGIGTHKVTYTVAAGETYTGLSKVINYTIAKHGNAWTVAPALDKVRWVDGEEAGALNDFAALYGTSTATISYSASPDAVGKHTVTIAIDEGTDYYGISKTLKYEILADTREYGDPDSSSVTYTWYNGALTGKWGDILNWDADVSTCYGIPSNSLATAKVASGTVIDLDGCRYSIGWFKNTVASRVTLTNGTLNVIGSISERIQLVPGEGRLVVTGPDTVVNFANDPVKNDWHYYMGNNGAISVLGGAKLTIKDMHCSNVSWYGYELTGYEIEVSGEGSEFDLGLQYGGRIPSYSTIRVTDGATLKNTRGTHSSVYALYLDNYTTLLIDDGTVTSTTDLSVGSGRSDSDIQNGGLVATYGCNVTLRGANPTLHANQYVSFLSGSTVNFVIPADYTAWTNSTRITSANSKAVAFKSGSKIRVDATAVPALAVEDEELLFKLAGGISASLGTDNIVVTCAEGVEGFVYKSGNYVYLKLRKIVMNDFTIVPAEHTSITNVVINGIAVDSAPAQIKQDDTYQVFFGADDGYEFEVGEDGIRSGTAALEAITVNGPAVYTMASGVAKIGTVGYATLAEAFAVAQEGETILLIDNVTLDAKIVCTTSCTLELAGYSITCPNTVKTAIEVLGGTLTIDGTAANSAITGTICVGAVGHDNCGLVINGGTYTASKSDEPAVQSNGTCANITISATGATFNSTDDTFYLAAGGTYTLSNCVVNGATGIYLKGGALTMTGTSITANGAFANPVANGNGANSTGDGIIIDAKTGYTGNVSVTLSGNGNTIVSENGYAIREAYTDATTTALNALSIAGGTYTGALGAFSASTYFDDALEGGTATCNITQGNFSSEIDAKYLADNRKCYQRGNGTWGTSPIADTAYTTYTWIGGAAGDWFDDANWTPVMSDSVAGIPNSTKARVIFNGAAVVNLGGRTATLDDTTNAQFLSLPSNKTVTFTNGCVTLYAKRITSDTRLKLCDGGRVTTGTETCIFAQNGSNGVLELGGNATVAGDINTYSYNDGVANIGNTIEAHGDNNRITGNVINQSGRMLVKVYDGSLTVGGLNVWSGGLNPIELSVSNATVTVGQFGSNHTGSQTSNRRKFDFFIPKDGFDEAPVKINTKYDLTTAAYFDLTCAKGFTTRKVPLISGIKSIPSSNTLVSHCTISPAKRISGLEFTLENNVLYAKINAGVTVLLLK